MIYRSECKLNRKHILLDQRTIQMGMNFTWVNTHKDILSNLKVYLVGMKLNWVDKLRYKDIIPDQRMFLMGKLFAWANMHKDIYLSLRLYFMGMMLLLLNKLCYKHILLDLRTNQKDIKKLKVCKYLMLDKYKNLC